MPEVGKIVSPQTLRLQHETTVKEGEFRSAFEERLKEEYKSSPQVQFSRHAVQRMEQRGVEMTGQNLDELSQAVEKARQKGARDTVVIGKQGAFIVNVPNNIVITTITEQEMRQNIFTNIDSAVFM